MLYAFPHIPSTLLPDAEDEEEAQWFSVTSTAAMRAAMEAILKTSDVLEVCLSGERDLDAITKETMTTTDGISGAFDLHLDDPKVPSTCRQMFDYIAAVYKALNQVDITTREELWALYQRYQLIPVGFQLPGLARVETENRSSLIRFCSELMVQWMQPYFATHPHFYMPQLAAAGDCKPRS